MEVETFKLLFLFCLLKTCSPALQPDDLDRGDYDNLDQNDPSLCARTCIQGEPPKTCYYQFNLEPYTTVGGACGKCPEVQSDCYRPQCVSADGYERAILTINRRMPSPSIQVCVGDTIVADVRNQMPGQSTSIHWHGVRQHLTPWMDGVPMVTQCPIMEGQVFRYAFLVDSPGTFFYHSHDGLQKVDGIVGSLVVREPDETNPVRKYYDTDLPSHTMVVQDWMHTSSNEVLPGLIQRILGQGPVSYLINGRGVFLDEPYQEAIELSNPTDSNRTLYDLYGSGRPPLACFKVRQGVRHRFRIVSGTCLTCQFRITFQDHKVLVIATDDSPIEPVRVDSLVISAGERYDIVLEADQPVASYWIVVRGMGTCVAAAQAAVLHYEGTTSTKPALPHWQALIGLNSGFTMNPRNSPCNENSMASGVCVSQLRNAVSVPAAILKPEPDLTLPMTFGFHRFTPEELFQTNTYRKFVTPVAGVHVSGMINKISNMVPPSPLLTQLADVSPSMFCDSCAQEEEFCECTHVIKVPLGAVVEFLIVDTAAPSPAALSHPFHIHGHDFYVLEQGVFKPNYELGFRDLQQRLLSRNRTIGDFVPSKDTITVPSGGYAVVRVLADNPGFWLYHCHFAYHLTSGMSAIIQVGEPSDFRQPAEDFPKCRQYLPIIEGV